MEAENRGEEQEQMGGGKQRKAYVRLRQHCKMFETERDDSHMEWRLEKAEERETGDTS